MEWGWFMYRKASAKDLPKVSNGRDESTKDRVDIRLKSKCEPVSLSKKLMNRTKNVIDWRRDLI